MTGFQNFMLAVCFGTSAGFLFAVISLCISAVKSELRERKQSQIAETDIPKKSE